MFFYTRFLHVMILEHLILKFFIFSLKNKNNPLYGKSRKEFQALFIMPSQKKLLFFCLLLSTATALADINIRVINKNTDFNDSNTFLRFESEPNNLSATINGVPLVAKKSYSFLEAKSGINVQYNIGGRIYFSLETPLDGSTPPEPNNSTIPSYYTRFDKVELTYAPDNPYSVANLTIIDFFSIPICLKTYKNGSVVESLDVFVDGETMANSLAKITDYNPQALLKENGKFLRVLGPPNDVSSVYPSMKEYIEAVKTASFPFQIQDHYWHNGNTPETQSQEYCFFGTINNEGDLLLQGGGDIIQGDHTIKILSQDLLDGIYGCNPNYFVDDLAASIGQNDVYSAVVRDALAGFNLGFIGSTSTNPTTGQPFNISPSFEWWRSPKAFEYAQPIKPFYNQWSRCISEYSNSYSFPFSDRWNPPHRNVQISLKDIDTLEITIKPDDASSQTFNLFNYFFNNCLKSRIPKAVNKIFGSHIKTTG